MISAVTSFIDLINTSELNELNDIKNENLFDNSVLNRLNNKQKDFPFSFCHES